MDAATLEHLILREIRKSTEISRRDLADLLDIARSTAGRRVDSLIERGFIHEKGLESRDSAGRPRRFLALNGEAGAFLGLDFDARRLFGTVIDFAGNILAQESVCFDPGPNAASVIKAIRALRDDLTTCIAPHPLLATGIGLPGTVDREARLGVIYPFVEGWENIDLLDALDAVPESLFVEQNTRAAALGNYSFGGFAQNGVEHLICLNIRTGISAAVISHGLLLAGRHQMAGEIRGWPTLEGPLETVATRGAIEGDWMTYIDRALANDPEALETLRRVGTYHGSAVAQLVQLMDPEVVVIQGAFARFGDRWLDPVKEATEEALKGTYFESPTIEVTTLGDFSGALGGAALAAEQFRPT